MLAKYDLRILRNLSFCFPYLPLVPFYWNKSKLSFSSRPLTSSVPFIFSTFLTAAFITVCFVAVIRRYYLNETNLAVDALQTYMGTQSLVILSYPLIGILHASDILAGLNRMASFTNIRSFSSEKLSVMDIFMFAAVPYTAVIAPVFLIGLVFFQFDPLADILSTSVFQYCIRPIITFSFLESIRTFSTAMTLNYIWLRKYKSILEKLPRTRSVQMSIRSFRCCRLLAGFVMPAMDKLVSVSITSFMIFLVLMLWISVKGGKLLAPLMHFTVVSITGLFIMGLMLGLHFLSTLGLQSVNLLNSVRTEVKLQNCQGRSWNTKQAVREVVSLQPFLFWLRPFILITMETSVTIFLFVVLKTVDALIGFQI